MAMSKKAKAAAIKNLAKARAAKRAKKRGKRKASPVAHSVKRAKRAKRAKRTKRRSSHLKTSGRIRPVLVVSGGQFRRPAKSKYFTGPTRINRRRKYRKNPGVSIASVKSLFTPRSITRILSVGGGVLGGAFLTRFLNTGMIPGLSMQIIPASFLAPLSKARPVFGLAQVVVGMYLQKKRSPIVKDIGIGMAAVGGFDLLTQILSLAGLTNLPTLSGMNVQPYLGMNVSPSFLGMNVQTMQGENAPSMADLYEV